jgi:hypothetical protein
VTRSDASSTPVLTTNSPETSGRGGQSANPVLWVVTIGLILAGAGAAASSLVLPTTDSMLLARVLTASLGVLLTSLGGVLASNLATQSSAARDIERQHVRFLGGAARNLATIYHGLQDATAKRRNGSFQHEETYQEAVLMSANSILAEYDSITALSGRMRGAFRESKSELDEIRNVFSTEYLLATTSVVAQREISAPIADSPTGPAAGRPAIAPEPVTVTCPVCGSRVTTAIAPRAGWTVPTLCTHCRSTFLIHRKADLTVYIGKVLSAPARVESTPVRVRGPKAKRVYGERFDTTCAGCGQGFSVAPPLEFARPRRVCVECAAVLEIDVETRSTQVAAQGDVHRAQIVSRANYYAVIACDQDRVPLRASYLCNNGSFAAVCTVHERTFRVERPDFRAWLKQNDPTYLAQRLAYEATGGLKALSDL